MSTRRHAIIVLILSLLLLAACGDTRPTTVVDQPATTPGLEPTATDVPLIHTPTPPAATTPEPEPTATNVPPTQTPTPPAVSHAPEIIGLTDQTVSDGERFPTLHLDEYVVDTEHGADKITWQVSGNVALGTRLIGNNLIVSVPDTNWAGSETLQVKACDPDDLCDSVDITFTVLAENDAPLLNVGGQVIFPGETFAEIVLADHVYDEESPDDDLTWSYSGNVDLGVSIAAGIATITLPDANWRGQETVQFQVCDPEGACGTRDALFWVMEESSDVEVTFVGNAGFLFTAGDKKILIDALFQSQYMVSDQVLDLMLTAQPPFDGIDLILATHNHADHFVPEQVLECLQNNPEAVFVSTSEAVDMLHVHSDFDALRERVIPIQLQEGEQTQLVANGVGLEMFYLSHGAGAPDNLGFLVTIGGHRLFHTGDLVSDDVTVPYLQAYHLPDKHIDVVLFPWFFLVDRDGLPLATEGIQAQQIIPIHWDGRDDDTLNRVANYVPDAIFFYEELDSWVLASNTSASPPPTIQVPLGSPATIDGFIAPGEWDGALVTELTNGGELLLMHDGGDLFLGIRARDQGYGSICVVQDNQVSILHASAALGSAIFEKEDDAWHRTQQFSWCCRSLEDSPERQALFETEGWMASISYMEPPEEMEYQITMGEEPLTLAVVYQEGRHRDTALWWPETLDDDCLGLVTRPGDLPEQLEFSPKSWVTLVVSTETVQPTPTAVPVSLPPLQAISVGNADQVSQLRRLEIPEFEQVRETCGVAFSPDGKHLAAACMSPIVPLWDVETGQLVRTFESPGPVWTSVAFSPDGKMLATGGQGSAIHLWDVSTGESLREIPAVSGYISVLAFSPDGQQLAAGSFVGSAAVWDVTTGERLTEFRQHQTRVNSVAFSPDGQLVVSGGGDNKARVWNAVTGEEILVLEGPTFFVEDVEFSLDGSLIAGASDDGTLRLWDATSGELLETMYGHYDSVNGLAFSPDGQLLASCSNDRNPRLWDVESGEMLVELEGHSRYAIRPAFNPSGTLLATVSWDGTVLLWSVPQGE